MSTRSKKKRDPSAGRIKRATAAGPIVKRANRLQNPRVLEALEEARKEEERLERRIARERESAPNGPAPGAQFAHMLDEPEPEPEVVEVPRPRLAEQVRLVEPEPVKPRRVVEKAQILGETRSLKVDELVWGYVLECGVDPKCVQVVSETEIICWNRPGPWPVPVLDVAS